MRFSVIIPVYNRPDEVKELLESLTAVSGADFELIIVEDGSSEPCDTVASEYMDRLDIRYFYKKNTGPGLTRNFGAERANGDYVIFFDSDCLIPEGYFAEVERELASEPADAWGGPDRAHRSFSNVQKAINYSMTSFLTTGGIRGRKTGGGKSLDKFYARSFNMGIRRDVFEKAGGFATMRVGEDIDLSSRLFGEGYACRLFPDAWVYHKRRTRLIKFFRQVFSFGRARVMLSRLHPGTLKPVHLLPSLFTVGLITVLLASVLLTPWVLVLPGVYLAAVLVDATVSNRSLTVGLLAVPAVLVQLTGYGLGFLAGLFSSRKRNINN